MNTKRPSISHFSLFLFSLVSPDLTFLPHSLSFCVFSFFPFSMSSPVTAPSPLTPLISLFFHLLQTLRRPLLLTLSLSPLFWFSSLSMIIMKKITITNPPKTGGKGISFFIVKQRVKKAHAHRVMSRKIFMYVGLNARFMHEEFRLYDTGITMKSSGSFLEQKEPTTAPEIQTGFACSYGNVNHHLNTSHLPVKKGWGTDLCCHWQPKSSKGGGMRENSFCPSEGGKERKQRRGGYRVGWGKRKGGGTVHASTTDQQWRTVQ